MTRNKPRIFLTLHPRGKNSLGEARQKLHHSAFHWGILISPKHTCHPLSSISTPKSSTHVHFEVSDAIYINPSTNEVAERDKWRFRVRKSSDPCVEFQILSRVFVGKVAGCCLEECVINAEANVFRQTEETEGPLRFQEAQ